MASSIGRFNKRPGRKGPRVPALGRHFQPDAITRGSLSWPRLESNCNKSSYCKEFALQIQRLTGWTQMNQALSRARDSFLNFENR
jgi:hypothetical protein